MLRRLLNGGKMAGKMTFRKSGNRKLALVCAVLFYVAAAFLHSATARADGAPAKAKSKPTSSQTTVTPGIKTVDSIEKLALKKLSAKYSSASALTMKVNKTLKLGVLEEERKSKGQLWISDGKLRMELEGAEKFLLVVNKSELFAVTFPAPEFKNAAIQVIRGETKSSKAKQQALPSLLSSGGFLKAFKATGLNLEATGEKTYFLQPVKDQADFKRAQIKVSAAGDRIDEFKYWDTQDNETTMEFSDVKFGGKLDQKLFNYTPPANADVMNL
jgi:outer membrane lipoprotein-sorting protein